MSDTSDSVGALLDGVSRGDDEAMETLLRKYRPYLRLVAQRAMRQMFSQKFDASDVVQQTCLEAFNAIASFRGASRGEFNNWITTILKRNLTSFMRSHTAQKRDVRREASLDLEGNHDLSLEWHLLTSASGPESKVVRGEAALILAESLSYLTDSQRVAVQMRFLEGCKLAEIADYMEASTTSVSKLIERGIAKLRKHLPVELREI